VVAQGQATAVPRDRAGILQAVAGPSKAPRVRSPYRVLEEGPPSRGCPFGLSSNLRPYRRHIAERTRAIARATASAGCAVDVLRVLWHPVEEAHGADLQGVLRAHHQQTLARDQPFTVGGPALA
jgi:hypothetical protein